MAKARWALIAETYEAAIGRDRPVLAHVFYGLTQEECLGYLKSHLATDEFLRACERGRWRRVVCETHYRWERLRD